MTAITLLFPAICGIGMWFLWPHLPVVTPEPDLRGLMTAIVGTDATMLGFLVSAGALVFAIAQTSLVQNLFRTGHLQRLLGALFLDAVLFLVALCGALLCLMTKLDIQYLRLLVALNASALAGLIPVGYTMWNLLVAAGPKDKNLDFD